MIHFGAWEASDFGGSTSNFKAVTACVWWILIMYKYILYVCVCTWMCMCTYIYVCMFVCLYVCMFVCVYVCMFVCLYVRYMSVRMCICNIHTYIHICVCISMYIRLSIKSPTASVSFSFSEFLHTLGSFHHHLLQPFSQRPLGHRPRGRQRQPKVCALRMLHGSDQLLRRLLSEKEGVLPQDHTWCDEMSLFERPLYEETSLRWDFR